MTGHQLRIGADDLWTLLEHLDLVEVLRDALHRPGSELSELREPEAGLLTVSDVETGQRCTFPAEDLRALRTAGLAAFVARLLLAGSVVTASVVGSRHAAQWQLGVLARCVPDVSHIAVHAPDDPRESDVDARVLDLLDLNGIGLSVTRDLADAVFGATLVVALGPVAGRIGYDQLAAGSLLVDAGEQAVSEDVRYGVARRYTIADLCAAHTDCGPVRARFDEVLLVELRDPGRLLDLEVALAHRLSRTALTLGIGTLITH